MAKFTSPKKLLQAYQEGFVGAYCDKAAMERLLASLPEPTFKTAGALLHGTGAGKLSTPFMSIYNVCQDKPFTERQTTGDCVSHGTRNALDVSRAVQIDVGREMSSFGPLGATEGIYGSRGHGGQGMSCAGAAEWVKQNGLLVRKNYEGVIDLTTYDATIGTKWGPRGVPADVEACAKLNPVGAMTQINNIEEARDALANGYAISVCSNQGFSAKRDSRGFAKPEGNWSHCMAWIACDDTGSEPAFLVQNSWAKWNDGGHPEWGQIPDGSFMITADVAQSMLKSDSSFAFSSIKNFEPTKLPSYSFEDYL